MMNSPPDTTAFLQRFGDAVRRRRVELALSQDELAHRCGLHRTYVSEVERGLKAVSLKALVALASALDVPPHALVKNAEDVIDG